jgi:hypothetical protein
MEYNPWEVMCDYPLSELILVKFDAFENLWAVG